MSTFNKGTTWNGTVTLGKQTGTKVTIPTKNQYLDRNIEVTINAPTASPSFSSRGIKNYNVGITAKNLSYSSSNNTSGVYITPSASFTMNDITYNGAVNGWVSKSNGASAVAATQHILSGSARYINGVVLENGKSFDITVPNGSSGTLTYHFSVDANGNTTITEG